MEDNERETAEGWAMINRDEIEAGDKCYTRDGGCLVARDVRGIGLVLGADLIGANWHTCGGYHSTDKYHPLDIIRIEKAPKPVVAEVSIGSDDMKEWFFTISPSLYNHFIKLTIINGKLEKSEQVK